MIINKEKYLKKINSLNDPYWIRTKENRWKYMESVIKLLKTINFNNILEIGAYKINYTDLSDNLDLKLEYIDPDNLNNKIYIKDATNTPWSEIPNKYYDIVLCCQVFEHLNNKQLNVFNEIKRISKEAIITIPYKWNNVPKNNCHYMITDEHIKKWTNNYKFSYSEIIEKRKLLYYKFN